MSDMNKWRERQRQIRLANALHWIETLKASDDMRAKVIAEYDNLLHSLEGLLLEPAHFHVAYDFIQLLFPVIFGYADWGRWDKYLTDALAWSQQAGSPEKEATLCEQLGDLRRHRNALDEAAAAYRQALTLFQQVDDQPAYAGTVAKLASLYEAQGNVAEAQTLCAEIAPLAQTTSNQRVIAHLHMTKSQIHIQLRQWEQGAQAAQIARVAYKEAANSLAEARAMCNVVACWANMGLWEQAQEVSGEIMAVFTHAAALADLIRLKNNLGVIAYKQQMFDVAEKTWQEALSLTSRTQESEMMPLLLNNLGMVYRDMGEWETGRRMLEQSAAAFDLLGNLAGWGNAQDNLAELYEMQGDWDICRHLSQQTLDRLTPYTHESPFSQLIASLQQRLDRLPPG